MPMDEELAGSPPAAGAGAAPREHVGQHRLPRWRRVVGLPLCDAWLTSRQVLGGSTPNGDK